MDTAVSFATSLIRACWADHISLDQKLSPVVLAHSFTYRTIESPRRQTRWNIERKGRHRGLWNRLLICWKQKVFVDPRQTSPSRRFENTCIACRTILWERRAHLGRRCKLSFFWHIVDLVLVHYWLNTYSRPLLQKAAILNIASGPDGRLM